MKDYVSANKEAYEKLASHYRDRRDRKSTYEEKPQELVNSVLKHFRNGYSVPYSSIEVGPGSGEILREFNKLGIKTFAIELSENMINLSKEISPKTEYFHADILEFEWCLEKVNIIYAGALIHLFKKDDARSILAKFYNWLTIDGVLFLNTTITNKSYEGFASKVDSQVNVVRYRKKWREEELINCVQDIGFKIYEIIYTDESDRSKKWIGLICKKK